MTTFAFSALAVVVAVCYMARLYRAKRCEKLAWRINHGRSFRHWYRVMCVRLNRNYKLTRMLCWKYDVTLDENWDLPSTSVGFLAPQYQIVPPVATDTTITTPKPYVGERFRLLQVHRYLYTWERVSSHKINLHSEEGVRMNMHTTVPEPEMSTATVNDWYGNT